MAIRNKFATTVIFVEIIFIVIFAFFVEYGEDFDATSDKNRFWDTSKPKDTNYYGLYPVFQHCNLIIFMGVGFLYTFMRKYGYSGVGMNMVVGSIGAQLALITKSWWHTTNGKIHIDMESLISAEYGAASAVISLGGVFGKMSPVQMVFFAIFEVLIYTTNEHFCISALQISDVGESVALHLFAGVFGCAVAYTADKKLNVQNNPNETSSYESNLFCLIGTVLLWCLWPSFNSGLATGDAQFRCMLNTFLALLASCLTAFAMSSLMHKDNKFTMAHLQNATLAGGVAVGTSADLMIQPFAALLIGGLGGCVCVFGFKFVGPFLARMNAFDSCGINSLHALPGLLAGITGVLAALIADERHYGHTLYKLYPAMAPVYNSSELYEIQINSPDVMPGFGRTAPMQACFQLLYVVQVMIVAFVTGLITGFVLRLKIFDPLEEKHLYLDDPFFEVPEVKEKKNSICDQTMDTKI